MEASSPLLRAFPFGVNVIHELEVPDVPSGAYVGMRYDSENTAQVWQRVRNLKTLLPYVTLRDFRRLRFVPRAVRILPSRKSE